KSLWSRTKPADDNNMCSWSMRCMLIEDGDRLMLIDTGMGDKQSEKFFSFYYLFGEANLKKSIENLGFGLDDITDVFLTHLHFDHCGGAVIYDKDRKSTRLNSSHVKISYAVFCLKKKTTDYQTAPGHTAA